MLKIRNLLSKRLKYYISSANDPNLIKANANAALLKQSSELLIQLRDKKITECVNIFMHNLGNCTPKSTAVIELRRFINDPSIPAERVFDSIQNIWAFLTNSNMGFLSQDISRGLVFKLHAGLEVKKDVRSIIEELYKGLNDSNFMLPVNGIPYPDFENQRNLFERQLMLENESFKLAWNKHLEVDEILIENGRYAKGFISELISMNFKKMFNLIKDEQQRCIGVLQESHKVKLSDSYADTLTKLSAEKLAVLSIQQAFKSIGKAILMKRRTISQESIDDTEKNFVFISVKGLVLDIKETLSKELLFEHSYKEYIKRNQENLRKLDRQAFFEQFKKNNASSYILKREMAKISSEEDLIKISNLMAFYLKITLKFTTSSESNNFVNVFSYQPFRKNSTRLINVFVIKDSFIELFGSKLEEDDLNLIHLERALPLIYKPAAWQDINIGAYYSNPSILVKYEDNIYHERALKHSDLSRIYDVVNYLSNIPWQINKRVLSVIETIWDKGGKAPYMPARYLTEAGSTKTSLFHRDESLKTKEKIAFQSDIQRHYDLISLRSDFLLKLQVARAFKDINKLYFPQQLDFRGRVYPIPPHLNHIGNDLCRSLLVFAEKKPLGPRGLRWLKIHLANKMGKDKLPMDDRVGYIDDNMALIERILKDPINNREWEQFDDGWQSLGIMFDLDSALRSRDPQNYLSGIPIHMDGTCNGLQHYAALGRDLEGAYEVNLINRDRPGDIYTRVCNLVLVKLEKEIETNADDKAELAKILKQVVKRKVIKQTVMTTVYGVTFIGAKDQVKKQLKEYITENDQLNHASMYLAKLTLQCVGDLFDRAHEIKSWLIKSADQISKLNEPVSWFTPLGLPVSQPYRNDDTAVVLEAFDTAELKINDSIEDAKVQISKQKAAFPPNYIHSMDSTHMMMTAMRMKSEGLSFASVHDSFWTHPCDLDTMNRNLREEFVRLYDMPLLENLRESFEIRFPLLKFDPIPRKGKLDLNEVLNSAYFFS